MTVDFVTSISGISLAQTPAFKKFAGGAAATVAVGIARLGGSSAFVGKVGEDEFGHMLANILKRTNVDDSGLRFDPNAKTTLTFVNLTADGKPETMFFRNPGADVLLSMTELDRDLIHKSCIFHYGSIGLIKEPYKLAHLAAIEIAKQSGSILSYAPNLRLPLWPTEDDARQGIMSIWNQADIIKDFRGKVPSLRVDSVDTTGVGDAFIAGLLCSLAKHPKLYKDERQIREALFFGNSCDALSMMQKGTIPSLPTTIQVLQFLERR